MLHNSNSKALSVDKRKQELKRQKRTKRLKRKRMLAALLIKEAARAAPFSLLVVFTEAPVWIQAAGWTGAAITLLLTGLAAYIEEKTY